MSNDKKKAIGTNNDATDVTEVTETNVKPDTFEIRNVSTTPQFPFIAGEQVTMYPNECMELSTELLDDVKRELDSFNNAIIITRIS